MSKFRHLLRAPQKRPDRQGLPSLRATRHTRPIQRRTSGFGTSSRVRCVSGLPKYGRPSRPCVSRCLPHRHGPIPAPARLPVGKSRRMCARGAWSGGARRGRWLRRAGMAHRMQVCGCSMRAARTISVYRVYRRSNRGMTWRPQSPSGAISCQVFVCSFLFFYFILGRERARRTRIRERVVRAARSSGSGGPGTRSAARTP